MTSDLLLGAGLVFAVEGLLYAAAPATAQKVLRLAAERPASQLRACGVVALAVGVILVALGRG